MGSLGPIGDPGTWTHSQHVAAGAPEEEPDSEGQGEGENDDPSAVVAHDPAAIGERIRETIEREALPDDEDPGETPLGKPEIPPHDPQTETCEVCDGFGETFTGSRVPQYEMRSCIVCQGRGFIELPLPLRTVPPAASTAPETIPGFGGQWVWKGENDGR